MDSIRPFLEIKKRAGENMLAIKAKTTSERDATLCNVVSFLNDMTSRWEMESSIPVGSERLTVS